MSSATPRRTDTDIDLGFFKKLLEKNLKESYDVAENLKSRSAQTEELKRHHSDLAENGTFNHTLEKIAFCENRSNQYSRSLQKALDRISSGTFGICQYCGCAIPKKRLQVVPHTTCCVNCKTKNGE